MLRFRESCCIVILMNTTKAQVLQADKFACLAADAYDNAKQAFHDARWYGASEETLNELGQLCNQARDTSNQAYARFSRLYAAYGKSIKVTMCPTMEVY